MDLVMVVCIYLLNQRPGSDIDHPPLIAPKLIMGRTISLSPPMPLFCVKGQICYIYLIFCTLEILEEPPLT